MVNYLVFSLASISILATAFPLPGHVPEITYRLFGQLPRLAARSTSFLFLFSPSPVTLRRLFPPFPFVFLVFAFCWPVCRRSQLLTCPFVQLPKTVYAFEDYVRDLEFPHSASLFSLSVSSFFRSFLWIKTLRLLTFSVRLVITGERAVSSRAPPIGTERARFFALLR